MYLYKYICIYIYTRSSVTWICGHQDYIIINVMIIFSLPKKPWQSCRLRFRWTRWDGANANPLAVEEGAGAVLGPLAMVLLACSTIRRSIEVEWCANSCQISTGKTRQTKAVEQATYIFILIDHILMFFWKWVPKNLQLFFANHANSNYNKSFSTMKHLKTFANFTRFTRFTHHCRISRGWNPRNGATAVKELNGDSTFRLVDMFF